MAAMELSEVTVGVGVAGMVPGSFPVAVAFVVSTGRGVGLSAAFGALSREAVTADPAGV
jgi:hypothetical protein